MRPATLLGLGALDLRGSVVQVMTGLAGGAGVAWSPGMVITSAHVAPGREVTLVLPDGTALPGEVLARDRRRDLALIGGPFELPAIETADPARLRPGALVFAVGHPLGVRQAMSAGGFQALGRLPDGLARRGMDPRLAWVQADIRLAPGNSGGPIADSEGRVIGIAAMIVGGLALAVPSPEVGAFLLGAGGPEMGDGAGGGR